MQDEIAAAIAGALEVKLVGMPAARRAHKPNLEAYEAFLRGRHEILKLAPDSAARGKQLLEQAIALDPAYSEPHAELGTYFWLQSGVMSLRSALETMPEARVHAQKALELSPADSVAHAVLGSVAGCYDHDWKEAGEQFRLAMAAGHVPGEVRVRCSTNYLYPLGRVWEAIEQIERALEHDPLNAFVRGAYALVLSFEGAYDRALVEAQKAVETDESRWLPHYVIGLGYALRGEFAAGRNAAERTVRAAPWSAMALGLQAGILAQLGEKQRADDLVTKLTDMRPVGLFHYHLLCSGTDTTANWLAQMIEDHDPSALFWSCLKPIRSSPRWPALAKMMNLPAEAM
jgi:tetratricopeptide (TPR) repeat protein